MWPKCAFCNHKGLIQKRGKYLRTSQKSIRFLMAKRRRCGSKSGVFGGECEVADLKQRQGIIKVPSSAIEARSGRWYYQQMALEKPPTASVNVATAPANMAINQPFFEKIRDLLKTKSHSALLLRLETQSRMPATAYGRKRANRETHTRRP